MVGWLLPILLQLLAFLSVEVSFSLIAEVLFGAYWPGVSKWRDPAFASQRVEQNLGAEEGGSPSLLIYLKDRGTVYNCFKVALRHNVYRINLDDPDLHVFASFNSACNSCCRWGHCSILAWLCCAAADWKICGWCGWVNWTLSHVFCMVENVNLNIVSTHPAIHRRICITIYCIYLLSK